MIKTMSESFALYRFPHENECTLMLSTDREPEVLHSYSELTGQAGFVFAPFEISDKYPLLVIKPDIVKRIVIEDRPNFVSSLLDKKDNTEDREAYSIDFNKFHSNLINGKFLKIVLSRCSEVQNGENIALELLFKHACSLYPRMFISLISAPQCGTWLMATPEVLLESENGKWHTMALAGTTKLNDERKLSLLSDRELIADVSGRWDNKNKKEQRYVSRYIGEILRHFTDNIDETEPRTVRAGNLFHLVNDFYFTFESEHRLGSLINELHPTPAVCGIPKHEAYKFISENESCERGYYSGFAGPLCIEKSTHLYVTLRCMQIRDDKYRLFAGGGLLKDSEEQTEWLETEAKMETMRRCLAIRKI